MQLEYTPHTICTNHILDCLPLHISQRQRAFMLPGRWPGMSEVFTNLRHDRRNGRFSILHACALASQ